MAFVTISSQPEKNSINSTLTSIPFRAVESTADTINVIATVYYNDVTTGWTQWGGVMRSAPNLEFPDNYYLNIADLVNSLPTGDAQKLVGLDQGMCMGYTPFGAVPQNYWANYSDWQVKVDFQREYLDGTTGLIELDPDISTTNNFYIHQGAGPLSEAFNGTLGNYKHTFAPWVHQQDPSDEKGGWLFMTDNPLKLRDRRSKYEFETYEDESLFLSCWNGDLVSPITITNEMEINTYAADGLILGTHTVPWSTFGSFGSAGYMTMNVGGKVLTMGGLTPTGGEGTLFANVAYYEVNNCVSNISGSALSSKSSIAKITINRNCKPAGYQRFLWQNQLGAWDMFTSNGMLTTQAKIKRNQFEKRVDMFSASGNPYNYGKSNWVNQFTKRHKVTTHDLENHEVDFIAKLMASPTVFLRIDMSAFKGLDMRTFWSQSLLESWADDQNCMKFIPIVIRSNTMKMRKTSENTTKVTFEYEFAMEELFPRM